MKKLNIILVILILLLSFTLTGFCTWYLPVIHLDSGNTWDNETLIYDGLDATAGSTEVAKSTWSDFIILDTYSEIDCEKIKFLAYYKGATGIQEIDIDLYYNSQWNDLYEGVFDDQIWTEIDVIPSQYLTATRIRFYAKKVDTAYFYGFEFWNPDLVMGNPAIEQLSAIGGIATQILRETPANISGTITLIEIYSLVAMNDVEVASFYLVSENTFSTRNSVYIGAAGLGYSSHEVSLDVVEGDYIGIYFFAGQLAYGEDIGDGRWYISGKQIPCTNVTFTPQADRMISLRATGVAEEPIYNYYGHFIK